MGKFEIYMDKAGEYRFRLKAGNGQIILASQGYSSKAGCINGIESVQENAHNTERFDLTQSESWKWHFNLKAGNGQVIGSSQMYEDKSGAENGIESVIKNAPIAKIIEE